jgi:hypothetical protein
MVDCSWFTGLLLSILRTLYIRIGSIRLKTAKRVGMLVSAEANTEEVRLAKKLTLSIYNIQYTIIYNIHTNTLTYTHVQKLQTGALNSKLPACACKSKKNLLLYVGSHTGCRAPLNITVCNVNTVLSSYFGKLSVE